MSLELVHVSPSRVSTLLLRARQRGPSAYQRKLLATRREIVRLIRRLFPDAHRIADAGGGNGELATLLHAEGYRVTTIDPIPNLYGPARRCLRRVAATAEATGYWPEAFDHTMARRFDLVVGVHPCGGTREVVLAAEFAPVFLVPCCDKWGARFRRDADVTPTIRRAWKRMGIDWEEKVLERRSRARRAPSRPSTAMWTTETAR